MADNDEILYQMALGHLENYKLPIDVIDGLDLMDRTVQSKIMDCHTSDQIMELVISLEGKE